jgi:hypothetical protein
MTDPKFQHTPGQLARWEAARLKREALKRPAPIGFDRSKVEHAIAGGSDSVGDDSDRLVPCRFCQGFAEIDTIAAGEPNAGAFFAACLNCGASTRLFFACGEDPVHLVIERWNKGDTTLPPNSPAVAPSIPTSVIAHQQPLDLSGVTLDAEGWSSEIPAPPAPFGRWSEYLHKTYPLCRDEEFRFRITGGDLVAIRIKARSASDTEGLPVGAVVRGWSPAELCPSQVKYYAWLGDRGWSMWLNGPDDKGRNHATDGDGYMKYSGAGYLPIDVRSA